MLKKLLTLLLILPIISCSKSEISQLPIKKKQNKIFEFNFDINLDSPIELIDNQDISKSKSQIIKEIETKTEKEDSVKLTEKPKVEVNKNDQGRKALDKLINTVFNAQGFEALINRTEKKIDSEQSESSEAKMWVKLPNQVKTELMAHNVKKSSVGSKISYKTGENKIKAKASGALSIVTVTLDMNDERAVSLNSYTPDQTGILGILTRLSNEDYQVEITGKSNIDGKSVFILKVTNENNNLDQRIIYEEIGFDPKNFSPVFWQLYSDKSEEPYLVSIFKGFEFKNVSDKDVKI